MLRHLMHPGRVIKDCIDHRRRMRAAAEFQLQDESIMRINEKLYKELAVYYDRIYGEKNYQNEAEFVKRAIRKCRKSKGNKLLDMGCGTGSHAALLQNDFEILGMDLSDDMLKIARENAKGCAFRKGDMRDFRLNERFDAIICMFTAINYNLSYAELQRTLWNFYDHMEKGGVLIFDFRYVKENIGHLGEGISHDSYEDKGTVIVRHCKPEILNALVYAHFRWDIVQCGRNEMHEEAHLFGIFEIAEVVKRLERMGFETKVYADFTENEWKGGEGTRPVIVGMKK